MTKDYLARQFENYHEITGDVVTPQMFGAVGDGVTDDTDAILAMFSSGKNVFLTEGTYLVNKQININRNIIVDGAGKLDAVIKVDQNFDYSISNTPVFMRVYADVTIKNIGIVTEYDLSLPHHDNEIALLGATRASSVVIDSCWFKAMRPDNGATKGITLVWGRGAKVLEVRNCLLQNYTNAKTSGCLWSFNWSDGAVDGENSIVADRIIFDNNIIEHTCWDEAIGVWTYNDDTKPLWKNVQITNNFITHDSFVENVEAYTNDNLISVNANTTQAAWNYSPVLIQGNTLIANYDCRCFIKTRCNMDGLLIKDNYLADNSIVRNSYYVTKQIRAFLVDSCHNAKIINNTFLSSAPKGDNFSPMFLVNGHVDIEGNIISTKYAYFVMQFQLALSANDYEPTFGASIKTIRNNNITTPNFSIYPLTAANTIYFEDNDVNNFSSTTVYLAGFKYIDWYIKRNKFAPNSVLRSPLIIDGGSLHFIDNINYSIRVFESKLTSKWNELEFRGAQQTFEVASAEGAVPYSELTNAILSNLANVVTIYRTDDGGNVVTPQMFGAKGDGITDDTNAIVAAETAANTSSKVLYFPSGTYKVQAGAITCHSGMTWIGEEKKSIIIVDQTATDNDKAIVKIGTINVADSGNDVAIIGLTFRGSETHGSDQNGISILDVSYSKNILIRNCVFQNNKYTAIRLIRVSNIKIFDCDFEATDCGVVSLGSYPSNDVIVKRCHFTGLSSLNSFTNYSSECVTVGNNAQSDACERWTVEDCIFEHKHTNGISFITSESPRTDKIYTKDSVVRNCTFRGMLGAIYIGNSENISVDGIFVDDTPKEFSVSEMHRVINIEYSKHITVRNVTSKCTELYQSVIKLHSGDDDILIDGIDAYNVHRSSNEAFAYLSGNNITIKNVVIHPVDTFTTAYISCLALTNSYVDIAGNVAEGLVVKYWRNSAISTVTNNTFVVYTEDATNRTWEGTSTSVADTNKWVLVGDGEKDVTNLSQVNQYSMPKTLVVTPTNASQFNTIGSLTDFTLMQDGYEFFIAFKSSTYANGKSASFNKTGNIIPIDQPFTFSNDYVVVCKFVQKNAKWVEVERTLEYYAGANKDAIIDIPSAPSTDGTYTLQVTVADGVASYSWV